jgi:hypothetical protein
MVVLMELLCTQDLNQLLLWLKITDTAAANLGLLLIIKEIMMLQQVLIK